MNKNQIIVVVVGLLLIVWQCLMAYIQQGKKLECGHHEGSLDMLNLDTGVSTWMCRKCKAFYVKHAGEDYARID